MVIALRLGRKAACPIRKDRKICTDQRDCLDPSTGSALLSAKPYNQRLLLQGFFKSLGSSEEPSDTAS